jgi:Holliday junction resolvasome RuvABC endonuclease subunit
MNILSIDASTKSTGWSVFADKELVDYGCITASSTDLIKRIHKMVDELQIIIQKYNVQKIILEEVRPESGDIGSQNIKTHRALMWLQGALAIMAHDICGDPEFIYLYPSEWRKVCGIKTGSGVRRDVLKLRDIEFVKNKFNINVNDDIADAICIGFAHLNPDKKEIIDGFEFV